MSILARILMLVACVPLLQPPGFCVCKAGGPVRTSSSQAVAGQSNTNLAPLKNGCCTQRNIQIAAKPDLSEHTEPAPQPCPAPADDNHMPGCPASPGVDRFKWVEPAQSVAQTLPPLEAGTFLHFEVVTPVTARSRPPAANWPSSPPIYLSHCSLVI